MNRQTAQLLEQHFDTAFAAPDGIAKLRELILTLAMQGKLVEQDPNDPPASELLKEIEAEKQRLVKAGKIKQPKSLPPIKPEEVPYDLPQGWEWVRLETLGYFLGGKTPSKNRSIFWGGEIPWVSPKDMKQARIFDSEDHVTETGVGSGLALIPTESILMVVRSGILRRSFPAAINKVSCTINQDLKALVPYKPDVAQFLFNMFRGFERRILQDFTKQGVTVESVKFEEFRQATFPLPPLPEQHRIVARIDQLMARCDELEKLRKEREEKRLAVHAAAVKQLLEAMDGSAWKFVQQHFGALYTVKENVAELRKAILQLAVMGRLVPQNPNDPPASELLKEIEAEKQRLVKAGKIKKPKPMPPIKPDEVPYELPQGWEWIRLGEIAGFENGDRSKRYPNDNDLQPFGIPFFGAKDMVEGVLRFDNGLRFISKAKFEELSNGKLRDNDFVMLLRGTVGKIARFSETDNISTGFINAQMLIIRLFNVKLCDYFSQYSTARFFQEVVVQKTTGSAVRQMPANVVAEFLLPLPPLPEQHRIVARIGQLMALCDTLDRQIDAATGKQTEILNAVMAQV